MKPGEDPIEAAFERDIESLQDEVDELTRERDTLLAALTPSAETKGSYIGEFTTKGCGDCATVVVEWTTIKDIMEAIRAQAAFDPQSQS